MKVVVLSETDGPESLTIKDTDTPEAQAGEVRVKLKTSALNRRDYWMTIDLSSCSGHRLSKPTTALLALYLGNFVFPVVNTDFTGFIHVYPLTLRPLFRSPLPGCSTIF